MNLLGIWDILVPTGFIESKVSTRQSQLLWEITDIRLEYMQRIIAQAYTTDCISYSQVNLQKPQFKLIMDIISVHRFSAKFLPCWNQKRKRLIPSSNCFSNLGSHPSWCYLLWRVSQWGATLVQEIQQSDENDTFKFNVQWMLIYIEDQICYSLRSFAK